MYPCILLMGFIRRHPYGVRSGPDAPPLQSLLRVPQLDPMQPRAAQGPQHRPLLPGLEVLDQTGPEGAAAFHQVLVGDGGKFLGGSAVARGRMDLPKLLELPVPSLQTGIDLEP
jgi:hypothetical protein